MGGSRGEEEECADSSRLGCEPGQDSHQICHQNPPLTGAQQCLESPQESRHHRGCQDLLVLERGEKWCWAPLTQLTASWFPRCHVKRQVLVSAIKPPWNRSPVLPRCPGQERSPREGVSAPDASLGKQHLLQLTGLSQQHFPRVGRLSDRDL